ncbi:unnamed protein product, partial [Urochloa humidicola]
RQAPARLLLIVFFFFPSALPFLYSRAKRANARRLRIPAAIPPAPFGSGGCAATGDGGEPGNRRADVYRVVCFQSTSRVCSPSTGGGARIPGSGGRWGLLRRQIKYLCSGSSERRRGRVEGSSGSRSGSGVCFLHFYGGFPVFVGCDCMRFVVVFLFALGKDLVCPPVGSLFRVGIFGAGCGFAGGFLLLRGGNAIFVFGWPWCPLETSPFISTNRSPMLFQRHQSILTGGLGWWFLRLHHDLESAAEVIGGFGFGSGGSELLQANWTLEDSRKMNRSVRGFFVIFSSFGVWFVTGGLYCVL